MPLPESPKKSFNSASFIYCEKICKRSRIENKLRRLLKCCFTLYKVPEAKQEEVIGQILKMDLKPIAEKIIEDTVRKAEEGFESVLAEK